MNVRPKDKETFRSDLKIIVIGTANTGKTSFINKWTKNTFSETYKATIGSEFGFKIIEVNQQLYRIQIWDLAGQDHNFNTTKIFSKDSHGCVVVCDATSKESLNDALKWVQAVNDSTKFIDGEILPNVLLENKCDLVYDNKTILNDGDIKAFAKKNNFDGVFRTSAKEGININESMEFLVKSIIARMEKLENEGNNKVFSTERKAVILENAKHNNIHDKKSKKNNQCC